MKHIVVTLLILVISCAHTIGEFYTDFYFPQDSVYKNEILNFTLNYGSSWIIEPNINKVGKDLKTIAKHYHDKGIELLYVGYTRDSLQGTQAVVANYNTTPSKYAEVFRKINLSSTTIDSGLADVIIKNIPMVRWRYRKSGYDFIEFFFKIDTYNMRIAFWARPNLFKRFITSYYNIMTSMEF